MTVTIIQGGKILDSQNVGLTSVNLAAGSPTVTGILPVANGGTGTATGSITGTGALTFTAGGTNTNVNLTPNGTGRVVSPNSVQVGTAGTAASALIGISSGNLGGVWLGTDTTTPSNSNFALVRSGNDVFVGATGNLFLRSGGVDAASVSATLFRIASGCQLVASGKTITAAGTTGARTINEISGSVNFAAAATSLVVTNSLVTTASFVIPFIQTNDATMTDARAIPAAGSFTLRTTTPPTAETRVGYFLVN